MRCSKEPQIKCTTWFLRSFLKKFTNLKTKFVNVI